MNNRDMFVVATRAVVSKNVPANKY